jgi:hypothetical protein
MVFCKKDDALNKKGELKKGYRMVTDKNGKDRYLTTKEAATNKESKKKVVEKVVKKVKKEKKIEVEPLSDTPSLTVEFDE